MREQPHYDNLLTKDFFEQHHFKEKKSMLEISTMLKERGFTISRSTLAKYCHKLGITPRNCSEAKRNWDKDPLDWSTSFDSEEMTEWIDGFLLGDGCIVKTKESLAGRATCTQEHQEFTLFQMSRFQPYKPLCTKSDHKKSEKDPVMRTYWAGFTKYHPDFYKHYLRWYSQEGGKQPPNDVRITPASVMLWYLGDGSVTDTGTGTVIRLSTDSFTPERVAFLVQRLNDKGIACHRTEDNRVFIEARGMPAFFDFIGRKSPVKCYDYKFDLPSWRTCSKRMRDVALELGIDYQHLAYKVKMGQVACERTSEQGRPRFLPEHIEALKNTVALAPNIWGLT